MATIFFFLSLAAPAGAQKKVLGVPLIGQQTSMWCFAAVTQMVGAYFGSTYLQQCEIAGEAYGRDDPSSGFNPGFCCANKQACTGDGYPAWDTLEHWGYPQIKVPGPPSYTDIKSWIDAGSPVPTAYAITGGGSHWILVDGYWSLTDGSKWVEVLNPDPAPVGDEEWFSFSAYLNGGVGDTGIKPLKPHTVTYTLHNVHWDPVCSQDFDDLNWTKYAQCRDTRRGRGQYPSDLATGLEGSTYQMGGSFRSVNDRPVAWNNNLTDFTNWVGSKSGWRPERVTVSSGVPYYSSVLVQESDVWESHYSLDFDAFQNKADNLDAQGYRLRDIFGYMSTGSPRFSGVWVKESGGYHYRFAHPTSDLNNTDNDMNNLGYRMARLSTYQDPSGTWRYAALWLPWGTVNAYRYNWNMTESEYETYYNTQTNNGFTLAYMSKFGQYYNAIFTK